MKARILVIDDDPLSRKLTCDVLALEGYEILQCENALQAIELLANGDLPELVLMDIALPGMDGLTLTRRMKADPHLAAIPIVALTAFAMRGDEQKAMAAGCNGYITKPIDTRRLPTQVADALAAGARERQRLRIMVVEDHQLDLASIGEIARLLGHVVLSNTTPEQAVASLAIEHPDVVLLDLNLPGIDGLRFVQLLKSNPETSDLPVVAVSAHDDGVQHAEMLAAGCSSYLVKPLEADRLLRALELAAEKPRT